MSLLKNLRWKVFLAVASEGRRRFDAVDVEDMYRSFIDPVGVDLEPYCDQIAEFCKAVPGFKMIEDTRFEILERNAQDVFKQAVIKTFKNEKAAKAGADKKANGFEHDILDHYSRAPPTRMGFPKSLSDEEIVNKCFNQFKAILLFHSRALRLFDDVPFLFTIAHFTRAYREKFEEEIKIKETGFSSLKKLLEWLPEIDVENGFFKVSSSFTASKSVREESNYDDEVEVANKKKKKKIKREIKEELEDDEEAPKKKMQKTVKQKSQDEYPPNGAANRRTTRDQKENDLTEVKREPDEPIGLPPMAHLVVPRRSVAPRPPRDYQPNPVEEFEEMIMTQNMEIARELNSPPHQHNILIFGGQPNTRRVENGFSAEMLLEEEYDTGVDENEPIEVEAAHGRGFDFPLD